MSATEKTPWYQNKVTLGAIATVVAALLGQIFGVDVGSENVNNLVFGSAAAVGGGVLAWKGGKAIYLAIKNKAPLILATLLALGLSACAIEPYARADAKGAEAGIRVDWKDLAKSLETSPEK